MFFQKHDDDEYGYKMWLSEDEVGDLLDAAHTSKCRLAFQLVGWRFNSASGADSARTRSSVSLRKT